MSFTTQLVCACARSFATFVASAQGQPVKYPYGEKPRGLLIYDATGHMSIQLMKMPHPKIASGDEEKVTPAERRLHSTTPTSSSARTRSVRSRSPAIA